MSTCVLSPPVPSHVSCPPALLQSHPCPLLLKKACTLWGAYTARRAPHEAQQWRSCSESNALMTENTPSSGLPLGRVPAPSCTPNSGRESPFSQSPHFPLRLGVQRNASRASVRCGSLRTVRRRPQVLLSIQVRLECETPKAAQEKEGTAAQSARALLLRWGTRQTTNQPCLCRLHAKGHRVRETRPPSGVPAHRT